MESFFIFLVVLFVVGVLTLLGHGIWLLLAAIFRTLFGVERERSLAEETWQPLPRRSKCPQCDRTLNGKQQLCSWCGLDCAGDTAVELADLATTARQLEVFRARKVLDDAGWENLQNHITARRRELIAGRTPAAPPEIAERVKSAVALPLWRQLEQLLEECQDVRNLTLGNRLNAIAQYRQLPEDQLALLSAQAQLNLARVLSRGGFVEEALQGYRRVLRGHPQGAAFGRAALEAGRLAAPRDAEQARWFLERALTAALSTEDRQEAEALLRGLAAPVAEEILEVIPVEKPAPIVSPTALLPVSPVGEPIPPSEVAAVSPPVGWLPPQVAGDVPEATVEPRPPRRSLTELLAAFMEERNILWGELVGGLLMVGCSIALVIYLWKTYRDFPYFPLLIFTGITASLFGAGLYALHRLKLDFTGQSLLVIATLLVPLNFLVMAGMSKMEAGGALQIGIDLVSLALFAGFLRLAGSGLTIERPRLLTVAVLGSSASQLLVSRFVVPEPTLTRFLLLGAVPVACYSLAINLFLVSASRQELLAPQRVRSLFYFLGSAVFALAVALGLLVYQCSDVAQALQRAAVLIALAGIPILAGGLLVHRGLAEDTTHGALRTGGTGLALLGVVLMLLAVALAWPQPVALILVCALNFAVLSAVAFQFQLPIAHAAGLPCLTLGYLTAFHLLTGSIPSAAGTGMVQCILSAQSGAALVALAVALGACAEWLVRAGHHPHGTFYAAGGGVVVLLSLGLVTVQGSHDPGLATVVHASYGAGFLTLNARWRRPAITYVGLALLLATSLWALWWSNRALTPAWGLVLAGEALSASLLAAGLKHYGAQRPSRSDGEGASPTTVSLVEVYRTALTETASAAGLLALLLSLLAPNFPDSRLYTYTAAVLAATALVLAWEYQTALLTWIGSTLLLGCLGHGMIYYSSRPLSLHSWAVPLLLQASLTLLASLRLRARLPADTDSSGEATTASLRLIFAEPLGQSAFLSSLLAVPLLTLPTLTEPAQRQMLYFALSMTWLAALWLVIACRERWPVLFTAFQAAMSMAVCYGVTAWLEGQGILKTYPEDVFDPRSLQAYGIGLGGLGLLWVLARIRLRSHETAVVLLEPEWPALDRVVLGGLVFGQAVLAVWGVWPGVLRELTPAGVLPQASSRFALGDPWGPGAWALLGTLAVVLIVALWERYQTGAVLGLLILALTVPVLAAGFLRDELATASALRWGLAACFLVCSAPLWLRDSLSRLGRGLRIPLDPTLPLAALARPLLLGGSVLPVLGLTTAVAVIGFSGALPAGPAPGSFFARMGWVASNVTPMALLSLGLVGHALRERSSGYAFAAGLVANVTLMGGYALQVVSGGQLDMVEWVRIIQLGSIGAAVWGIAWLISGPWTGAWRERADAPLAQPLMTVQLGMAAAGNVLLLGVAVWLLVFPLGAFDIHLGTAWYRSPLAWTTEAGSGVGWLALGLTIAAVVIRNWHLPSLLSPDVLGWLGLLLIGLLACSVDRGWAGWGYRALMVGWAGYALAWSVLIAWIGRLDDGAIRQELSDAAAMFVSSAGLLALFLALKAAIVHDDQLWAAGALALASPAGAILAVQRRREHWAFTAGLGINLAASLVVWHVHSTAALEAWWAHLLQANVIATAAGALLWLGMRRHIYGRLELSLSSGPLLATQVSLGLLGNAMLLDVPLVLLACYPPVAPHLAQVGEAWGWLALILAFAASLWYADQVAPRNRVHILVIFGLALGVLAACAVGPLDTGNWLSFHVLTVIWCMTGLFSLAAGWVGTAFRLAGSTEESEPRRATLERIAQLFPADLIPRWVSAIGLLVVGLALRGIDDPQTPYWSAGATLIVSTLFGGLALWSCRPGYVYASGLLIYLAGGLISLARPPHTMVGVWSVNVLCISIASCFWSVVELALRSSELRLDLRGRAVPFCHMAAIGALTLLTGLVAVAILPQGGFEPDHAWTWTAPGMTALALALTLWDADARFTLQGLYAVGLLTIGLSILSLGQPLTPWSFCLLGLLLALYGLLTSALRWDAPRRSELWQALRIPARPQGWPAAWFAEAHILLAAVVVGLSVWMALGFETIGERLAGSIAVCLLLPAGVLLTASEAGFSPCWRGGLGSIDEPAAPARASPRSRVGLVSMLCNGTLALGVLAVAEIGWALLDPAVHARWLYRSVLLMVALAFMTPVYGIALRRLLPAGNLWAEVGRRLGPRLGALATLMLVVVLVQEGLSFDPVLKRTPMALPAVLIVIVALAALMAASISFAVVPGRDPLGLSERGRMVYVYACEVLLVFLFLHLKLTRPEMFGTFGAKYWSLLVMLIAFLGVGLGEFFSRRGLRVLAEPLQRTGLFLPLLPLLAFWTKRVAPASLIASLGRQAPGMQPLLAYIDPAGPKIGFDQYAFLWLLAAALLAGVAAIKRSYRYGIVAALAANFGWWSLLYHYQDIGLAFMVHPQLWLIPLAVICLTAEYLNRDRLTTYQRTTLRYLSLLAIYVSSTADMFIAGVGESIAMPLLLALLSVAGVLSGILLRVRAFLFLGVSFLFLDVFAMIWHAAVGRQQYWIWWVCGIILGGSIIVLFAVFEKRRNEVLRLMEELKSWK